MWRRRDTRSHDRHRRGWKNVSDNFYFGCSAKEAAGSLAFIAARAATEKGDGKNAGQSLAELVSLAERVGVMSGNGQSA
jgi:hypothetical protein